MKANIQEFKKSKPFLVCIDSDGCAIDAMTIKHFKSFGPEAVTTFHLERVEEVFLDLWNRINLTTASRGINRFKGLVMSFELMEELGYEMPDLSVVKQWTQMTKELSYPSLEKAYKKHTAPAFLDVMRWSNNVNKSIKSLEGQYGPFKYVKETLKELYKYSDIAIVSSANSTAIHQEWTEHGMNQYVSIMCGQESGSKEVCIRKLMDRGGYDRDSTLMIGDAYGDEAAAHFNDALFYPIIAGKEDWSWELLLKQGSNRFINKTFKGAYADKLKDDFHAILAPINIKEVGNYG